ncbi:MAG: peptidoglycan bridge formation glycyltransferase FemA/FemB family protein [Bacilli bacterium]|nr:peptidoglycan bridge formation glycyltransferase FemA/FemB family protein [Bacilli bacterium]
MKFIENVEKEKYIEFTRNHPKSHFLQSYAWGEFCKKAKNQIPKYVGLVDDNDNLIATCLILLKKTPLFGYSYGYAPRGFITDYTNKEILSKFTEELKKYMVKEKIIYIKFDPDIVYQDIDEDANPIPDGFNNYELYNYLVSLGYNHTGFYKLYNGNQPRYTFRIDLKKPWEEVESKMSKSFLKSVRRSENYNLTINNEVDNHTFWLLMKKNSEKDGFGINSEKYYEMFTNTLNEAGHLKYFNVVIRPKELVKNIETELDNLKQQLEVSKKKAADINNQINRLEKELDIFKNEEEEEKVICSLVCTYTDNRAWTFYIGNDSLANLTFAITRAYYEAIKDAHLHGYDFIDLFGTPGDPHTKFKNLANIHDFKRKFGDKYTEFMGEFDLVNKKGLYKMLPIMLKFYRKLRRFER